jgi:hypothetical protein
MAKKRSQTQDERQRQSRKEVLQARKQQQQTRQVRLAVIAIAGLLAVILVAGLVNELFIRPTTPVAVVQGIELPMRAWQDRVRFQRSQMIIGIEDLAETFGQDIGQVQQFAGQQLVLLEQQPEVLGQAVLDEIINEQLIQTAAVARGISVSDADVQSEIESSFNFFDGAPPTPLPTATETVMPTPSLTPIPTTVITEVVPTNTPFPTAEPGPTLPPAPTSTAVSIESFQNDFDELIGRFDDLGADERFFRDIVRARLYEELFLDALADEEGLTDQAEHTSFYYLAFESEEESEQTLSNITSDGFLEVWNVVRSTPVDETDNSSAVASEVLWRTLDELENIFGLELAEAAFNQEIEIPGTIIFVPTTEEGSPDRYYIIMVSGRETRSMSETLYNNARQELLRAWLDEQRLTEVEIFERWRTNVPTSPIVDRRFLQPPTPGPPTPTFALPQTDGSQGE